MTTSAEAKENGLARTPPMGWRSWNLYSNHVNQRLLENIMDAMARRDRKDHLGVPTSYCDLGYCDVGLDDAWQVCDKNKKYRYHDADTGYPVVDKTKFPDMKKMVDHAHSLNLTAGWYGNNCICKEKSTNERKFYEGDVKAFRDFGFDSWKLDACGAQLDLQLWDDLITKTGKPVVVENCHWGSVKPYEPNATWCPWNFYRTSEDIMANYGSVLSNLATVNKYAEGGLSRPGCWAYPDMLEVGCQFGAGSHGANPGLSIEETRSHFGAWCIVSSPLVLSHDPYNDTVVDEIWPVIANKDVSAAHYILDFLS